MTILALISACGVIGSLAYYASALWAGLRFARRAEAEPAALPKIPPRVTILKPLRGASECLFGNLVSYLELAYSRVEFIFGVSSYEDRAIDIPVALRAPYQFANLSVVVGEEPGCTNRKVAKLIRMAERASEKSEIFVLSDADVQVERDHLKRVVPELLADDRIGVVTCVYRARPRGSFASRMESLFINTDFAPQLLLAEAIEPMHYALGATIAVKRKALEEIGSFRAIRDVLADDYFLGLKLSEAGYDIRLSSSIVTITCEEKVFSDFWNHQLRWARTFHSVRPVSLSTIAIHGPFWALLFLIATHFSLGALGVLALVLGTRVGMARVMLGKVLKLPELIADAWLVPLKDLVMTGVYFASLTGRTVLWGGRKFRLMPGGVMRELV